MYPRSSLWFFFFCQTENRFCGLSVHPCDDRPVTGDRARRVITITSLCLHDYVKALGISWFCLSYKVNRITFTVFYFFHLLFSPCNCDFNLARFSGFVYGRNFRYTENIRFEYSITGYEEEFNGQARHHRSPEVYPVNAHILFPGTGERRIPGKKRIAGWPR